MGIPKQTGTKSPQPYTKRKRSGLPQGRAQHLVFLWQIASIENMHIYNITQREQVILIYIYIYAILIYEKESMNF